jgi:RND superfamily putative drug exporter
MGSRRRWIWPLLVLMAWLLIGLPSGSFAGKLSEVQTNDNASFLPESAESTEVLEALEDFQDQETFPATVVIERRGGVTQDDLAWLEDLGSQAADVEGVVSVGEVTPSSDGEAAQLVVELDARDFEVLGDYVEELRGIVDDPPDGLTVEVGGPAGVQADFSKAFGAIDGLLLVVALTVVLLILLAVYRSPVLPFVVLFSAVLALGLASGLIYLLADLDVIALSGQSQGILFILVVGAATDYSLLLVARFREELRDHESKYDAMRAAYRGALEPILASGATVILGLLCLLLSDLAWLQGLGPVGAIGIAFAVLAALTLLPAILLLLGRKAYWPVHPDYGTEHTDTRGLWGRIARLIGRRARVVWVVTFVVLAGAATLVTQLDEDPVPQTELFLVEEPSVRAQEILDRHFASDSASPVQVLVPEAQLGDTMETLSGLEGIAESSDQVPTVFPIPDPNAEGQPLVVDGHAMVLATLADPFDSQAATDTVEQLRTELPDDVLVGGATAINLDVRDVTDSDRRIVIPAILLVIFLVLVVLLRALVAPLLLLVANVLSFGATLGISAMVFQYVFDFPPAPLEVALIGFVFLVALGIDYSIFLMTRVREESIRQGTHPGILKGLSATGGVITSAGVVLAATFAALGVIPILFMAMIGFIVAFGVLLDALIVRSLLVPALSYDVGRFIWWPSRLSREADHADAETQEMLQAR